MGGRGRNAALTATLLTATLLVVAACSDGEQAGPDPTSDDTTNDTTNEVTPSTVQPPATSPPTDPPTTFSATTEPATTTTTVPFVPPTRTRLVATGPEEVVFDWTDDRCEDAHIPDIAARAFRDAAGTVHLTIGHWNTYVMRGPSLDEVASDCSAPVLSSPFDPDPSTFADSWWIGSPYTVDGQTVYAVVHNEYRGDTHDAARPGQCPSDQRLPCLDTSFVMTVSTDGGRTFAPIAEPPGHLIATLPYPYLDDSVPSGIRQPSNVIDGGDGFFYLFGNVSDQPDERQWVCAMRTDDLADPGAWRYWDGDGFDGVWLDPYRDAVTGTEKCAPLADAELGGSVQESIVFDERLGRFVMVGISADVVTYDDEWGVYYSTSENLVDWTLRELLIELPAGNAVADPDNELVHAYPALIDPDSSSLSFGTSDGELYLYISRFNAGGNSLDRDLLRFPIAVEEYVVEPAVWTFDDGALGGWFADNHLTDLEVVDGVLTTTSTGDDPWFLSGPISVPSVYDQLRIRMRVSAGDDEIGQVFWITSADGEYSESKSLTFDVDGGGEWVDHVIPVGQVAGWADDITALRIDPAESSGRTIEIDSIEIVHDG